MTNWSHSRLQAYQACPRRYAWHYVEERPESFVPAAFQFGRHFHEFAERYARHCFRQHRSTDLEEARRLAAQWCGIDDALEQLCLDWAERTEFDWSLIVADGDSVERWLTRELPNGDQFVGRIDLVLYNEAEQALWIRDYKTSWYASPVLADEPPLQLLIYAWLAFGTWPVPYASLQIEHVRSGTISSWDVEAPLDWVQDHIMCWVEVIESDCTYVPAPGQHCAYCPFLMECDRGNAWRDVAPRSGEDAERIWLELEGQQERIKAAKAVLREFLAEYGPRELPDGRVLGLHTPAYAAEQERLPAVPRTRVRQFLAAAQRAGVDLSTLVKLDAAALVRVVAEHQELQELVDWRAPRRTLTARKPPATQPEPTAEGLEVWGDL